MSAGEGAAQSGVAGLARSRVPRSRAVSNPDNKVAVDSFRASEGGGSRAGRWATAPGAQSGLRGRHYETRTQLSSPYAPRAQCAHLGTPSGGAGPRRSGEQETPPSGSGVACASARVPGAPGTALWCLRWCGDRKFGGFEALALVGFANAPPGTMCFGGRAFVGGGEQC